MLCFEFWVADEDTGDALDTALSDMLGIELLCSFFSVEFSTVLDRAFERLGISAADVLISNLIAEVAEGNEVELVAPTAGEPEGKLGVLALGVVLAFFFGGGLKTFFVVGFLKFPICIIFETTYQTFS